MGGVVTWFLIFYLYNDHEPTEPDGIAGPGPQTTWQAPEAQIAPFLYKIELKSQHVQPTEPARRSETDQLGPLP